MRLTDTLLLGVVGIMLMIFGAQEAKVYKFRGTWQDTGSYQRSGPIGVGLVSTGDKTWSISWVAYDGNTRYAYKGTATGPLTDLTGDIRVSNNPYNWRGRVENGVFRANYVARHRGYRGSFTAKLTE